MEDITQKKLKTGQSGLNNPVDLLKMINEVTFSTKIRLN